VLTLMGHTGCLRLSPQRTADAEFAEMMRKCLASTEIHCEHAQCEIAAHHVVGHPRAQDRSPVTASEGP
jgi:DNA-binding sugar fermentation-stimulating protein